MRGKDNCSGQVFQFPGITPAYAGKSFNNFRIEPLSRDHPRLCGEKQLPKNCDWFGVRITPAYAGKRASCKGSPRGLQDHPRLCGEKADDISNYYLKLRITPAYAGKSIQKYRMQFV